VSKASQRPPRPRRIILSAYEHVRMLVIFERKSAENP
jgi:hypothetical protein